MIRGLYTSAWAMKVNAKQMDVITNNLANVNTNAFKKDTVVLETFPEMLTKKINDINNSGNPTGNIGTMQFGSDIATVYTYFDEGNIQNTGNNLDFAIHNSNNSFFTIQITDDEGNITQAYTRDGAFALDANGMLVTKDGNIVVGENGPIILNSDNFTVDENANIIQNGEIVGRFLISTFDDVTVLTKRGGNLLESTVQPQQQAFNGTILQGSLEQSNVNAIKEMVNMINVLRAYEANQKMITIQDSTLDKAVNQIGSIG